MKNKNDKRYALVLDKSDNTATLLADAGSGDIVILKGIDGQIQLSEAVAYGHKTALRAIRKEEDIIKYGQCIGRATKDIAPGEWIHIHNMSSVLDQTFNKRIEM